MTLTVLALLFGLPVSLFILFAKNTSTSKSGSNAIMLLKQCAFVYVLLAGVILFKLINQ